MKSSLTAFRFWRQSDVAPSSMASVREGGKSAFIPRPGYTLSPDNPTLLWHFNPLVVQDPIIPTHVRISFSSADVSFHVCRTMHVQSARPKSSVLRMPANGAPTRYRKVTQLKTSFSSARQWIHLRNLITIEECRIQWITRTGFLPWRKAISSMFSPSCAASSLIRLRLQVI